MIKINEKIQELANEEFSTDIQIIKKGLDVFYKYIGKDIHEYLKENKLDDILARVMDDLDMTKDEVLYLAFDSYLNFVLDMTLAQRLARVKVNEYVYNFNSMEVKKVYKQVSVHDILEQNRINLIQEQEKLLDLAISKAQDKLTSKNKEVAKVQEKVSKIEGEISKINSKILLLKSKDILTITPSQRANNRRDITQLETKSTTLIKELQELKDELKQLKNERFYIQEDISDMIEILENPKEGFYQVEKIKDQYR